MNNVPELTEREKRILHAVVQCYVTTAEPVGSRTVVKRFNLDLSPATVRNVMADLEDAGFLQQVHTSSGRIPTDRGYRYFVDYLMRVHELTLAERARIERELSRQLNDSDEVMRQTSQLLALTTYQTGLVTVPEGSRAEIRNIEAIPIGEKRAAVLIVDSCGRVHTMMVTVDEPFQTEEIPRLNNFLNEHLRGMVFDRMASSVNAVMRSALDEQRRLAERALNLISLLPVDRPGQLYLEGAAQLFEQPEFKDVAKAREVFGVLEEREHLLRLLRAGIAERARPEPMVVIGSEMHEPGLKEISVVASPYRVGNETAGVLGVLGPRRMPYSRLTAVVDYTANMLSRFLTRLAG